VTAAYKAKLEEDQKWLAAERIREARDAKADAVKAGHMGNFYRCLSLLLSWHETAY
jgi:coiled-coil domain-containing protein 55